MNAERLLELYEQISEAPNAIARLRRFVLDLAVRGKLVEQDATDEPASALVHRLASEKEQLIKNKVIKKPRELGSDDELIPPHDIPTSWRWCRLDSVGAIVGGGTPSAGDASNFEEPGSGVAWLTPADLGSYKDLYISQGARDLSKKGLASSSATLMPSGAVLFTSRAPIGYVAIAKNPIATNQGFKSVVPYISDCSRFIALTLKALATEIDGKASGTTFKEVSGKIVAGIPFPLAPLAEQHRIVAKVDELMALCDRLEEAHKTREGTRDKLTAATLARLTTPEALVASETDGTNAPSGAAPNPTEPENAETGSPSGTATAHPSDFATHARFAIETLPALTSRPDQIKTLRQTILNLAVRGKLVEQDPADEPVAHFSKDVESERLQWLTEGRSKKQKALSELPAEGRPFEIPETWQWVRLGDLVLHSDSGWSPQTQSFQRNGTEWGVLKVSAVSWGAFDPDANKQVLPGTAPRLQAQVHQGDFLISRANTAELVARAVIVEDEPINLMMSDKIVRLSLASCCNHRYLWMANNRPDYAREYYALNATGVSPSMKNVSRKVILDLPIPLPPLAEQHRIVAKVDALMALCDQLEAALTTADTTRTRLLEALLHEALEPAEKSLEAAE